MAISDRARQVHDELFPDHVSALSTTDPELIEYFDNFAFDEVLQHSALPTTTRLIVQLAALIATPAHREYRVLLGAALNVGVSPVAVKEFVYQAVPYCGMGKVYDFIHITNEVLSDRGVALPLPGQSTTNPATRLELGLDVQRQVITAERVERLYASANPDELHIQHLLSANCFGDHLTRSGLDLRTRELVTFSMLVAQGGCDPQVAGHVAANVNVGNDRSVLIDVITQLLPFIGYPRMLNGLRMINEAAPYRPTP